MHSDRKPNALFFQPPSPLRTNLLNSFLNFGELAKLSNACSSLYGEIKPNELMTNQIKFLLQAMIDFNPSVVTLLLNNFPKFIFMKPRDKGISEITSRLTFRKFSIESNETIFMLAQKYNLASMVKLMMPYYLQTLKTSLEDHSSHSIFDNINQQWILEKKTNANKHYESLNKTIQTILSAQNFIFSENKIFYQLSEQAETQLAIFQNSLLMPCSSEGNINIEQLFCFAYGAYIDVCYSDNYAHKTAFRNYILGFIQSLLNPEFVAAIFQKSDNEFSLPTEDIKIKIKEFYATIQENKDAGIYTLRHISQPNLSLYRDDKIQMMKDFERLGGLLDTREKLFQAIIKERTDFIDSLFIVTPTISRRLCCAIL